MVKHAQIWPGDWMQGLPSQTLGTQMGQAREQNLV